MQKTITTLIIIISLFSNTSVAIALSGEPQSPKELAEERVKQTFGNGQWEYFEKIIFKESSWIHTGYHYPIINGQRKSSAVGLCGTLVKTHNLPNSFIDNIPHQIDWCIKYTKKYGTPEKAFRFHEENGWW